MIEHLHRIVRIVALVALIAAPLNLAVAGAPAAHPCCADAAAFLASPAADADADACDHDQEPSCGNGHCGGCVAQFYWSTPLLPAAAPKLAHGAPTSVRPATRALDRPPGPPPRLA